MLYCINLKKSLESNVLPLLSSDSPQSNPPHREKAAPLFVSFSSCRIRCFDVKQPLSRKKTCLCLRTWACRNSPFSTAFEEYTIIKPLDHLQACVLSSRHFTSPWAICFRRPNNSVSQKLINKFTTSCGWLGKQQHGWMLCWYGFNVELSEVQIPDSFWSLIMEHNFFCCCLPAPKRQLCFLPFNETVL